jgi:hypothetical protein
MPPVGGQPEGVEGKESIEYLKSVFCLTQIAHAIIPNIIPAMDTVPDSTEEQKRAQSSFWRPNGEIMEPSSDLHIVDAEIDSIGISGYDGDISNYAMGSGGNIRYIGVLSPWKIISGPIKKIEACFNVDKLRKYIDKLPDDQKNNCRDLLQQLQGSFAAETARLVPVVEEPTLESCEPQIAIAEQMIGNLLERIEAAEVPTDPCEYVQVKDQFFRDQNPIFQLLKDMQRKTDITPLRFTEFADKIEGIKKVLRKKYPIEYGREFWSLPKKDQEKS